MGLQIIVSYPEVRRPVLWRVMHDIELANLKIKPLWRPNMPEVQPLFPNHHTEFDERYQRKVIELNPRVSNDKLAACYTYKRYLTNDQGFGDDSDPRANYFTMKNLDCELPRVEALTTGGSVHRGEEFGDNVIIYTLHYSDPIPSAAWLYGHREYLINAVSVDGKGTPRRFPQGEQPSGEIVTIVHPFFTNVKRYPVLVMPKYKLQQWAQSYLPDPFTVYIK